MDASMFERTLKLTGEFVAGTTPEQLGNPTPCTDWDVRGLLNHLIGGCLAVATGASGQPFEASEDGDLVGADHVQSYNRAAADAAAAFRSPGAAEKTFAMPWGPTPGSMALGLAIADVAIHGWDLAKATGQEPAMDDDVAHAVYGMTSTMMAPLGEWPRGDRFDEPAPVPDDAPIAHKAVAYLGREP